MCVHNQTTSPDAKSLTSESGCLAPAGSHHAVDEVSEVKIAFCDKDLAAYHGARTGYTLMGLDETARQSM